VILGWKDRCYSEITGYPTSGTNPNMERITEMVRLLLIDHSEVSWRTEHDSDQRPEHEKGLLKNGNESSKQWVKNEVKRNLLRTFSKTVGKLDFVKKLVAGGKTSVFHYDPEIKHQNIW